ncbi:MAG: 30S ribosomal protein S5 [Chloroflexi bacterium]|nr:30S ribosomal protein S5 [Chloroflexota bacterium]
MQTRERIQGRDTEEAGLSEKVIEIKRVSKVVKGGRHFSFSAAVVVGDGQGKVSLGLGKAGGVPEAVRKAGASARKNMMPVAMNGDTIPHMQLAKFGAAKVLLKPASPGTGIIAGGAIRAVVEVAGIKDVLTKSLGCSNPANVARATIKALSLLRDPKETITIRKQGSKSQQDSGTK